jgi:hypothetical protein
MIGMAPSLIRRASSSALPALLCPDEWLRTSFFSFDVRVERCAKSCQLA